jgi:hypothetical protein
LALGLWSGAFAGACTKQVEPAKTPAVGVRDTRIVHEPCAVDGPGVVQHDLDGDGKPDARHVMSGGREVCRALDLNFDGRVDVWVYNDVSGKQRRRESDYDRDGRIDEIALYRDGQLFERQRATTLAGRLDTWQSLQAGKLIKSERDSDGDGRVDQWWEYGVKGCNLVHSDADGDGRPDPGSTVKLCESAPTSVAASDESQIKAVDRAPVEVQTSPEAPSTTEPSSGAAPAPEGTAPTAPQGEPKQP